jgi:hypothetical protein
MNFKTTKSKMRWQKAAIVIVLVSIAGYRWYTESRQTIDGREVVEVDEYLDKYGADDPVTQVTPKAGQSSNATGKKVRPANDRAPSGSIQRKNGDDYLVAIGGGELQSPAGLIYAAGSGGEHRVDHVMRHARDDPSRPAHGVFNGDKATVLKLIDEAYEMIQEGSKYVRSEKSRGNIAYTVSMGRKVGYEGGQKGRRSGNRALRKIRLILDGPYVITAYPYR